MAGFKDLPNEIQEMIWADVVRGTTIVLAHKNFPGTPIKVPSVCGPTSDYAYSRDSALIIEAVQLKLTLEDRVYIRINVLNFDFTNFVRFIKYYMATPGDRTTPRGDIARLGVVEADMSTSMVCRHKITSNLEYQPAKLAAWIKFSNNLFKNTNVKIGAMHNLMSVELSPALLDLSDSQTETETVDMKQAFLIANGIHNWRMEAQWKPQYGKTFPSVLFDHNNRANVVSFVRYP